MAKVKDEKRPAPGYSLFSRITAQLAHPALRTVLTAKSEMDRVRAIGKRPKILFERPHDGQPIVLLALYEKGRLRPDILRLLAASKRLGYYTIGVNTLRLSAPDTLRDCLDCYIERPNYGRDFGSYKTGFLHLFERRADRDCPRLLLVNDSVYYSEDRLEPFLREMMESDVEVLGSTENYEINYHLGSFCIAMAGDVLRHPRFLRYWRRYRLTDVRPVVIKRGEMGLSRTLKRCASSEDQVRALYDSVRFSEFIADADPGTMDRVVRLTRRGDLTPARRFLLKEQMEVIERDFLFRPIEVDELTTTQATLDDLRRDSAYLGSYSGMVSAIRSRLISQEHEDLDWLHRSVVARLVDIFRQHSQIHQSPAILLDMGLPIVKLDLVYRGMGNMADVNTVCDLLSDRDAAELRKLLLARPFGGDTLFGWRRAAFMNGLI